MIKRYSSKRESIRKYLQGTKEHPSAETVYNALKNEYPDLSLATVYRNLNELCDSGKITSVAVVLDKERFDADTRPHSHAICSKCGKITDVDEAVIPEALIKQAGEKTGFEISYSKLQFIGLCEECRRKEEENG